MEFRNLTPVDALAFTNIDTQGREYHIVVLKAGYRLHPITEAPQGTPERCSFTDRKLTHFAELLEGGGGGDENPGAVPLVMADEYFGEPGKTTVKYESDLAPYKPRCDVIVTGNSYAPQGKLHPDWIARLRVIARPAGRKEDEREPQVAIDKSLQIMGPHHFEHGITGWSISKPQAVQSMPLQWEHAFGGACQVKNPEPEADKPFFLNEVCYTNPLGSGWMDKRWMDALKKAKLDVPEQIRAPNILHPSEQFEDLIQTTNPPIDVPQGYEYRLMAQAAKDYPFRPAGYTWIGRAWIPRLPFAGTYDSNWQDKRWPGLPEDFDMAYWNGAPTDQQIPFPDSDVTLELLNLTPARHPECGQVVEGGTYVCAQMPLHRGGVLIRSKDGLMLPMPMTVDTIVFDTDKMQVNISWRTAILQSIDARVIETRFEQDPKAALIRIQDPHDESNEVAYG